MAAIDRHLALSFAFLIPLTGCSLFSESDSDVPSEAKWEPAAKPAATPEGPAPRLVIENDACDFGTGAIGQYVTGEYRITNAGDAPLKVRGAGCGRPWQQYAPGTSATLKVRCRLSGKEGPLDKPIRLCTNDPARRSVTVRLQGNAVGLYETEPPVLGQIDFGRVIRDARTSKTIQIRAASERKLFLKLKPLDEPRFDAELKELEPGVRYKLTVIIKPVETGPLTTDVSLETGLEIVPELRFSVEALSCPRVWLSKKTLYVSPALRRGTRRTVRVYHTQQRPVKITGTGSSYAKIQAHLRPALSDRIIRDGFDYHEITISLPPGNEIPEEGAKLEVFTDDVEFPVLELLITNKRLTQHSPSK